MITSHRADISAQSSSSRGIRPSTNLPKSYSTIKSALLGVFSKVLSSNSFVRKIIFFKAIELVGLELNELKINEKNPSYSFKVVSLYVFLDVLLASSFYVAAI